MDIKVFGKQLKGISSCVIPPSKSHSIRCLLLASLSTCSSKIYNILDSQDIEASYNCFSTLGVHFAKGKDKEGVHFVEVFPPNEGIKNYVKKQQKLVLNVGNSGTLLYMLSMLVASLPTKTQILGDRSIKKRPISPVLEALDQMKISYTLPDSPSLVDDKVLSFSESAQEIITIYGREINEELNIKLEGKFSQVVSGLLFSIPFFHKKTSIALKIAGEAPYIKMTLKHLKERGILLEHSKDITQFLCEAGQQIKGFCTTVPSDWSSASFLILASIAMKKRLTLSNMYLDEVQADAKILDYLKNTSRAFLLGDGSLTIVPNNQKGVGCILDVSSCPDLLPVICSLSSIAEGSTTIEGIDICRYKECNRVMAMRCELQTLGVHVVEEKNRLTLKGVPTLKPFQVLNSYGDHRIAMALTALSLALKDEQYSLIKDIECCTVSYPNFLKTLTSIGANIEIL